MGFEPSDNEPVFPWEKVVIFHSNVNVYQRVDHSNENGIGQCPFGDFGHHVQIFVGDYIPKSWVMFNLDTYRPLNGI